MQRPCFSSPLTPVYIGKNLTSSSLTVFPLTPAIWLHPQLPFWTIAHCPKANSDIESVTVLLPNNLGSQVELFMYKSNMFL